MPEPVFAEGGLVAGARRRQADRHSYLKHIRVNAPRAGFSAYIISHFVRLIHYRRLKTLDREQDQLLQWALKGFPEESVIRENEKINRQWADLKQRRTELETKTNQARRAEVDTEGIESPLSFGESQALSELKEKLAKYSRHFPERQALFSWTV